jgi:hypothetical protein
MPTQDAAASITFVVLLGWCLKLAGAEHASVEHAPLWPEKFERPAIAAIVVCFLAGTAYAARTDLRPVARAERADFPYRYGFVATDENDRDFQWTAGKALDLIPIQNRWLKVVIGAVAPDSAEHPVEVKVWRDGDLVLRLTRRGHFPVERWIRLPDNKKFARIEIQVSRTWRASDIGRNDSRVRGAAVGKWEFAHWTPKGAVLIE